MLIMSGDPDCIVLHCLLYFLQHKHPIYNCNDTAMSRPFPHSSKQRHQVEAWMDKTQWFVWNCPPEPQPHFFMFGYWCGMWERSVRQESYDFCVSPSLLSFSHFVPELVGKIFGLFLSQKPGWNFSYEPTAKLVLVTVECPQSPIFSWDRRDIARLTVNGGHLDFQMYRGGGRRGLFFSLPLKPPPPPK